MIQIVDIITTLWRHDILEVAIVDLAAIYRLRNPQASDDYWRVQDDFEDFRQG